MGSSKRSKPGKSARKPDPEEMEVRHRSAAINRQQWKLIRLLERDGVTPEYKAKKKAADAAYREYRRWMKELLSKYK